MSMLVIKADYYMHKRGRNIIHDVNKFVQRNVSIREQKIHTIFKVCPHNYDIEI